MIGTDHRDRRTRFRGSSPHRGAAARRRREAQLVIVAARKQRLRAALRLRQRSHEGCGRQRFPVEPRRDVGALADVAHIREQSVGDVDRAVGDAPQARAEREAGSRRVQPLFQRSLLSPRDVQPTAFQFHCDSRGAELARHPNVVAYASAVTPQRLSARDFPHDLDTESERPARSVSADQIDPVTPREREEAA